MKQTTLAVLFTVALIACDKSEPITQTEQKKQTYFVRIQAAGTTVDYSNVAIVKAANGGQNNENNFGKLDYVGYSNEAYVLNLTNKQQCGVDFQIKWLSKDTTIYVPGSSVKAIQLPGAAKGGENIKARPLYKCGSSGGDLGWIEVESPVSLPVTFKSITAQEISPNKVLVSFEVADVSGVNQYNIQLSTDGKTYKNVGIIWPDANNPNRKYSITISL